MLRSFSNIDTPIQQTSAQRKQQNYSTHKDKEGNEKLRIGQDRANHLRFLLLVSHGFCFRHTSILDAREFSVVNWETRFQKQRGWCGSCWRRCPCAKWNICHRKASSLNKTIDQHG